MHARCSQTAAACLRESHGSVVRQGFSEASNPLDLGCGGDSPLDLRLERGEWLIWALHSDKIELLRQELTGGQFGSPLADYYGAAVLLGHVLEA